MIVTAMLAWYQEDPDILYRAVSSAACIADEVIALDGRWDYYPGEANTSPPEQYTAIREAAAENQLRLRLTESKRTWSGQVAKRQAMLDMATDSDWVMPLDADWELKGDRWLIRKVLSDTLADAISIPLYTPHNYEAKLRDVAATTWHEGLAGMTVWEPMLWRRLEDMRLENYHWCYSGLKRNGEKVLRVSLWGLHNKYPQAQTEAMDHLEVWHHCLHRDERTILANRAYCQERDRYSAINGREP